MKKIFIIVIVLMAFFAQGQTGSKSKDKNKENNKTTKPASFQQQSRETPPKREKCCNWIAAVKVFKS